MKTLDDLTSSLFTSLNRLEGCDSDQLEEEIARSKTICDIATRILGVTGQQLEVAKLITEHKGINHVNMKMITGEQ